jgi:PmbA protein
MTQPEQVLQLAMKRASEAEVFWAETEETPVQFEANRLKMLQARHTRGVALRVVKDGRIGFAATTRVGDETALVDLAIELAQFGAEAAFSLPAPAPTPEVRTFDAATLEVPVQKMVDLGRAMIDDVLAAEPELICDADVHRTVQRVRVLNSAGTDLEERTSVFSLSLGGQRVRGTDMLWVGDEVSSCSPVLDVSPVASAVRLQVERARENVPVRTADLPVIFTPYGFASALYQPLMLAFNGKMVLQGASPLVESLGVRAYDEKLMLWDDPLQNLVPSARRFDDEGVPARRVPLVERGVVREFLYDLQTAGLAGRQTTASAHRSLTSQPQIFPTALMVEPGTASFEELLRGMDEGIVVEQMIGAGQGNALGGDFSGNVVLGYKVERGQITGRVKNTMVGGNVHQLLKEIAAIGGDARWVGAALHTGSLLFPRIAVSSAD